MSVGDEDQESASLSAGPLEEPRLRRLFDGLQVGVLVQGPRAEVLYCNPRAADLLGFVADELLGRSSLDATGLAIHPDGSPLPGADHPAPRVLATGRPVRDLLMGWSRDGRPRVWLLVNADPERDASGQVRRVVCTFTDVTAQREAEQRLRESEERYRLIVEKAQDIIYRTDASGFFIYVNPEASRVMGWPAEELIGKHFLELIREDHRARVEAGLRAQYRNRTARTYDEFVAVARDGREVWIGQNVQLVADEKVSGFQAVARDITARKGAEVELEKEREQLEGIVAHAPAAMAILDGQLRYLAHSRRWLEEWGLDPEADLRGRAHPEVLPGGPPSFGHALTRALAGEVVVAPEELVPRRGGGTVYMAWTIHPWRRGDGPVQGVVAVVQDIDLLVRARQAALEASRLKSQFLSNVSFELRAPLGGVLGMARLLLEGGLESRQREYAEAIRDSGRQLLAVVDDILDFSQLESGRVAFESVDLAPRAIVEQALRTAEEAAARKGLRLTGTVAEDVPVTLRGDPARLRQALQVLLSNAVKFTSDGSVTVRVAAVRATAAEVTVRFEVADTGPGIPHEAQVRLFEPFTETDGSSTRRHGGAGLGLAICRRLAEGMRGELGWRSAPGRGSTFWLAVPLARPLRADAEAGTARRLGHVLVVEDNVINQRVTVAMLERLGYTSDTVENGLEALQACDKTRYDAILMDCQMPEMDGFRATAFLREREGPSRHTPIIAITASVRAQDREQCLTAGMDDYLAKPVHMETLGETLRRWIEPAAGARRPAELPPDHPLRVLEAQTGSEAYAEVIEVFLQTAPRRLEEMREALEGADAGRLGALAHSVKGAASQLGLQGMSDLCAQVEALAGEQSLASAARALASLERDYRAVQVVLEQERRRVGTRPGRA